MNKLKTIQLLIIISILFMSCTTSKLGKQTLDLEKIDFATFNVNTFYEDALKEGGLYHKRKSYTGDTYFDHSEKKWKGYFYFKDGTITTKEIAVYKQLSFTTLLALTDTNDKLLGINAGTSYAEEKAMTSKEIEVILHNFTTSLGKPEVLKEKKIEEYLTNTWHIDGKIIRLVIAGRSCFECGDIEVVIDELKNTITSTKPSTKFLIEFFVVDKVHAKTVKEMSARDGWTFFN